jgi:hypothetical protein
MDEWLKQNGKCAACLAGSVLRFSLGAKPLNGAYPILDDYAVSRENGDRLEALNDLRLGLVKLAADWLRVSTKLPRTSGMPSYDGPNGEWWKAMKSLLKDLREAGE